MYRDVYHLEYVPFTSTPDSDLVNLSRRHQAVVERVVKSLKQQQSLIVFFGESGLGKVALLRSALAAYSNTRHKTITIDIRKIHFNNQIYFKDIIKAVYEEIGYEIKYQISPDALIDLHDIFMEEREKDSTYIIIINHAHLLPDEVLKSLPKLIDAYPGEQPLAQLILAGDPALDKHLREPNLQPLKKRVQLVAKLDTFNRKESIAHIRCKLAKASPKGTPKVFSNAAIRKIVKAANGIPRNLNMICTDALVAGCRRHKRPIPARIVKQVLADFQVHETQRTPRWTQLSVAVLLLLALAAGVSMTYQDSVPGPLRIAAQWPQQMFERVQPLLSGRALKAEVRPVQVPTQAVRPMAVEAPAAIPVDRPAPKVAMPSPSKTASEEALPPRQSAIQQVANLIDQQQFPLGPNLPIRPMSE
ncbi:ExeA family protein, partial [Candidatus Entotheonella palauensis]|uniref:ExeA family protein n=1 Tax=Candidatus Entotheonella palauensis TaxID=93172 RepID=UPI000B7D1864